MSIQTIQGNLLDATEQYIVHQCNCVSVQTAGLAYSIFHKFPYADVREKHLNGHSEPGTIDIHGNGKDQRYVINLFGQYYPGEPRYPGSKKDGYDARIYYFMRGLDEVFSIPGIESVAFPWMIGCGLAGGDWERYERLLNLFSKSFPHVDVKIYQLVK